MATLHVLWTERCPMPEQHYLKVKENVSMKTKKMNMWQWVRGEADIEIARWDGLRLLWLVPLEFTASDQLRGSANWSNKFTSRDIRYLTSTALRFKLCLQICLHIINCCCCHLLVLSTWISSFPVCRHGSRTLSSHGQLRTGFSPSVPPCPPLQIWAYMRWEESCIFTSPFLGVNCWLWVYGKVII